MCKGKALVYQSPDLTYKSRSDIDIEEEREKIFEAFQKAVAELGDIVESLSAEWGKEYIHIFRAQITMLEDATFFDDIVRKIRTEAKCCEDALHMVYGEYSALFQQLADDRSRQRLADLTDIYKRVMRNLLGVKESTLLNIPKESIIVATELLPSDTALMNRARINGLVSEGGGAASHLAILAKSLSIPAVVGMKGIVRKLKDNDSLCIDASDFEKATLYIDPDTAHMRKFDRKAEQYRAQLALACKIKDFVPATKDGKKVTLSANIGSREDLQQALAYGAKNVGLLRTEFLFMHSPQIPNEQTQFEFYRQVASRLHPGKVVVRTLDIGGDKELKGIRLPKENNPFLGVRGIRFSLQNRDLFITQLKAILRAAAYGNVKVMFPMIADIEEFEKAKELLGIAGAELAKEGKRHRANIETGVMVETPAAVLISDILTESGDFVSVGSNDLTQYLLTADRDSEKVAEYYRTFSPAVFRALRITADNVRKNGKHIGICGELGGMDFVIPVLIGLGIREFSMNPRMLALAAKTIREVTLSECRSLAQKVLSMRSEREIKGYLRSRLP